MVDRVEKEGKGDPSVYKGGENNTRSKAVTSAARTGRGARDSKDSVPGDESGSPS